MPDSEDAETDELPDTHEWEVVNDNSEETTDRMWVTSGWIYRTVIHGTRPNHSPCVAMVYVEAKVN